MNHARPTLSALMRCAVIDDAGQSIGHVHEVRCDSREGDPPAIRALLVGTGGLLRRLGIRRGDPREIPWSAVVDWQPGTIVVRQGI
jgi:hypothetical protein